MKRPGIDEDDDEARTEPPVAGSRERMSVVPVPVICTVDDMMRILDMSRRQIDRQRKLRVFPFPEIDPPLDSRPRWLGEEVIRVLRRLADRRVSAPAGARKVRRRAA